MYPTMYVICPACRERHDTDNMPLHVVDIREGEQGQDVITYKCPTTGKKVGATVYRGR